MILNDRQITALAGEGMMTSKQIIRLIMGTVGICVALILSSCANSENRATGTETVKHATLIALMILGVAVFVYLAGFARS